MSSNDDNDNDDDNDKSSSAAVSNLRFDNSYVRCFVFKIPRTVGSEEGNFRTYDFRT